MYKNIINKMPTLYANVLVNSNSSNSKRMRTNMTAIINNTKRVYINIIAIIDTIIMVLKRADIRIAIITNKTTIAHINVIISTIKVDANIVATIGKSTMKRADSNIRKVGINIMATANKMAITNANKSITYAKRVYANLTTNVNTNIMATINKTPIV